MQGGHQCQHEYSPSQHRAAAGGPFVHSCLTDLEAHQRLTLVVLVGGGAGGLAADDAQLHVLDLEAHKQEVDAADDDVLEVVFGLGVLELDVQAVLYPDVHLDARVHLRGDAVAVDPDVLLADDVGHAPRDGDADVVAQLHVDAVVRLILLLHVLEVEVERLRVLQLAGRGELLDEGEEFVVIAAVEEHFCASRRVSTRSP